MNGRVAAERTIAASLKRPLLSALEKSGPLSEAWGIYWLQEQVISFQRKQALLRVLFSPRDQSFGLPDVWRRCDAISRHQTDLLGRSAQVWRTGRTKGRSNWANGESAWLFQERPNSPSLCRLGLFRRHRCRTHPVWCGVVQKCPSKRGLGET